MTPEEIRPVVEHMSGLIGDPPVGGISFTPLDTGYTQVVYKGTRGTYVMPAGGDAKPLAAFAAATGNARGIFHAIPQDTDRASEKLITSIIKDIGTLSFVIGFVSQDVYGVKWARYSTRDGEVTLLTRLILDGYGYGKDYLRGEILVGDKVVGFRARLDDGIPDEVEFLPVSQLALEAADSLGISRPDGSATIEDSGEELSAAQGLSGLDQSDDPSNITELVERVSAVIGDPPTGVIAVDAEEDRTTGITYWGGRGIYVISEAENGLVVVFGDPATRQVKGTYNFLPEVQDRAAAKIISGIVSPGSLSFVLGYKSADPDGVNWKRFGAREGELIYLTREVRRAAGLKARLASRNRAAEDAWPILRGEIVGPGWVIGFRGQSDDVIDEITQLPESTLARDAADSLTLPAPATPDVPDKPPAVMKLDDPQEAELEALLPDTLSAATRETLDALLAAEPLAATAPAGALLDGAEACAYLERCMSWMVAEATRASAATSSAHWLYLLRRLSRHLLAGQQRSTWANRQSTAEVLSGMAGADRAEGTTSDDDSLQFAVSADLIPSLLRLLACARLHVDLSGMYRWCAKGAALQFPGADAGVGAFVGVVQSAELEAAVRLYDERHAEEGHREIGWRSTSGVHLPGQLDETGAGVVLLAFPADPLTLTIDADILREDMGIPSGVRQLEVAVRFHTEAIGVAEIAGLMRQGYWADRSLVGLLACLRIALNASITTALNVMRRGYTVFSAERFEKLLAIGLDDLRRLFPDVVGNVQLADILPELLARSGSVWPLRPGPIIRRSGDNVLLDIAAASSNLRAELSVPGRGGGRLANVRGRAFEQNVQDIIDDSPWRPGEALRELRGRSLRVGGRTVTDIDAVGERDGILLAVSAKSVPYHDDYERGEYRSVRNLVDRCDAFVAEWADRLGALRESPVGDNYDLSRFRDVTGVVVLPFPPFCRTGPATEYAAPGLRAVSSLSELKTWVDGAWQQAIGSGHPNEAPLAAFNLAVLLAERGDMDGAKAAYLQAMASGDPDYAAMAAVNLGTLLVKQGDTRGAEDAWQQAVGSGHPDQAPMAAVNLGQVLAARGEIDAAKVAYQQAIESRHPDCAPEAALRLATLLQEQGDVPGARKAWRQVINSGDSNYAPIAMVNLGVVLEEAREIDAAKAAYRQAIDSGHPDQAPKAALNLGYVLRQQGEIDAAKAAYRQAIDSGHPDWAPKAMYNMGNLLRQEGEIDAAKAAYRQAIDSGHPDQSPMAANNLGLLLRQQGEIDAAKAAYRQAIDSGHPDQAPLAANLLGLLLAEQEEADAAKAAYWQAIDSGHPDQAPMAANNLGLLHSQQEEIDAAKAAYQQAIDSGHPDYASAAAFNLGALLARNGEIAAAKAAYQQAIDSGHPDYASAAAFNLGALLEGSGEIDAAKAAYRQAIDSSHPDYAGIAAFNLGALLAGSGEIAAAKEAYQQAFDSQHPSASPAAAAQLRTLA